MNPPWDIMPMQFAPPQRQASPHLSCHAGFGYAPAFFLIGDYPLTVGWGQHGKEQKHAEER